MRRLEIFKINQGKVVPELLELRESDKRVKCVVWNNVNCSPEGPEDVPIQACQETPTFCSSC